MANSHSLLDPKKLVYALVCYNGSSWLHLQAMFYELIKLTKQDKLDYLQLSKSNSLSQTDMVGNFFISPKLKMCRKTYEKI